MEDLKASKAYKKAFNHADMICTYMPEELERLAPFGEVEPEYKQGFEDRVKQYQMERDVIKSFSVNDLREKYGRELGKDSREKSNEKGQDKEM